VRDEHRRRGSLRRRRGAQEHHPGRTSGCVNGRGLAGAATVAISPDDAFVYVGTRAGDGIAVFARNTTTGDLTQLSGTDSCVNETGADGRDLYVVCNGGAGLSFLKRTR